MLKRIMESAFKTSLSEYPVVTVFGPRQSGKTTLVKACCPEFDYVNLEDKESRELAATDYKAFFSRHKAPLVIDEIQRLPELVSGVQTLVDQNRDLVGQFVLTGSQQSELAAAVDESLAGRTAVLDLMPLSIPELGERAQKASTDELLLRGFMPELWTKRMNPTAYYRNYFRTYVERDVRRIVNIKDLIRFERFITLLAGRVGQVVNFSALANETGVSAMTISSWLSVLESSFLVYRLKPHFPNVSKRVIKSPKVYFSEPGLVAYLLGIETPEQMSRDPLRGQLFENMVVMEAYKRFSNEGRDTRLSFLRTEKGFEIDLLISSGSRVRPIEVKSSMTFNKSLVKNLVTYVTECRESMSPLLVYDGDEINAFGDCKIDVVNFRNMHLGRAYEAADDRLQFDDTPREDMTR